MKKEKEKVRVLCVSESNTNVVMWSHYANEHTGAVIQLGCGQDSFLSYAREVKYSGHFPEFVDVQTFVKIITGETSLNPSDLFRDLLLQKHEHWRYEAEWRVARPARSLPFSANGVGYADVDPSIFGGLYLGCRMPEGTKQELANLAAQKYPHMAVYEATMSETEYKLDFKPYRRP